MKAHSSGLLFAYGIEAGPGASHILIWQADGGLLLAQGQT
jgi:hypothetical protein